MIASMMPHPPQPDSDQDETSPFAFIGLIGASLLVGLGWWFTSPIVQSVWTMFGQSVFLALAVVGVIEFVARRGTGDRDGALIFLTVLWLLIGLIDLQRGLRCVHELGSV